MSDLDRVRRIALGMVNAYLVRAGDGFILVDTGLPASWPALESELKSAGCLPSRLKLVIITHGDFDHTGGCSRLQQQYGAQVAIHQADAGIVETGRPLERELNSHFLRAIIALRRFRQRRHPSLFPTFKPDLFLVEGQSLTEYRLDARILHVPGHTPGSIAVLFPDGDIITGDIISHMFRVGSAPFIHDREQLRASLKRLQAMDLRTIYPGHGKPLAAGAISRLSA